MFKKNKIIIIGDTIIDINYLTKPFGKAAEFDSKKNYLINKNFNLGGSGMSYMALKKITNNVGMYTIANIAYKKIFNKIGIKDTYFSKKFILEKNRYWQKQKLLFQINNLDIDNKTIKLFQKNLLIKLNKIKTFSKILLCDYRHGIFTEKFTKKIIKILNSKKCIIYLDQQSTSLFPDLKKFKNINFLVLNESEYNKAFKAYNIKKKNFVDRIIKLKEILNIDHLIIKLGSKGSCFLKNNKIIFVKSKLIDNSKNINTIGAGDFFISKLINIFV